MDLWERASYWDLHDAEDLLWEAASPLLAVLDCSELISRVISVALGWALRHFMGKSFQGKFSASVAIMKLNAFCQGTEGIYLQVIRNTRAGLQTSPTGISPWRECCSGTRGCDNTESKGSLGLARDCHICFWKCSQGRLSPSKGLSKGDDSVEEISVSGSDLAPPSLNNAMSCGCNIPLQKIPLSHKKSLIRKQAGKNFPFWITTAVSKEIKVILANPSLCISFFYLFFFLLQHE